MDGVDGSEIMLLDGEGCPTDQRIMGALNRASDDQKALVAHFDAFKFPTSEIVQFRALVTPCLPSCQPVICPVVDGSGLFQEIPSLGRRKRRMLNGTFEQSAEPVSNELEDIRSPYTYTISTFGDRRFRRDLGSERNEVLPQEEMLLVRSIHISDRFGADKKRDRKLSQDSDFLDNDYKRHRPQQTFEDEDMEQPATESRTPVDTQRSATCINLSTVLGAGAVVVGVQIALLIVGAMLFLRKRDASKKLLPQQTPRAPGPQQTIFVKRY